MRKKGIIKTVFLFSIVLTISFVGFAKDELIHSTWTVIPPQIDGVRSDWADDVLSFEKKVNVDYGFKNDAENLYIVFIFKDPNYLSSIDLSGITLWLNPEGKKKEDYGIKFIKKQITADEYIALLEEKMGEVPEAKKSQIRANPSYVIFDHEVIDKKTKSSQPIESQQAKPAVFRLARQKKMVIYEFAVPLKRLTDNTAGIGTELGKAIKVGFEWGGMTKEIKEAMMKRLGAQSSQAREGAATSDFTDERRVGGESAPLSSIRQRSPKKYSFWVDVQLAENK